MPASSPLLLSLVTQMWPQAVSGRCTFPPVWDMTPRKGLSWHRGVKAEFGKPVSGSAMLVEEDLDQKAVTEN